MAANNTNGKAAGAKVSDKVVLSIPVEAVPSDCYVARHIDFNLTPVQLDALALIQHGLIRERAKLTNGQLVQNAPGAVRWMLEQVADRGVT